MIGAVQATPSSFTFDSLISLATSRVSVWVAFGSSHFVATPSEGSDASSSSGSGASSSAGFGVSASAVVSVVEEDELDPPPPHAAATNEIATNANAANNTRLQDLRIPATVTPSTAFQPWPGAPQRHGPLITA